MSFEIIELSQLSGIKCTFYTIKYDDESNLFEDFLEENQANFEGEIESILKRINSMANKFGAREDYFKLDYGKPGDGVCALYDEDAELRLMCIRFPNVAVIMGSGGQKNVRAIQDDPLLDKARIEMIRISELITERIRSRDIRWSHNRTKLIGDLNFNLD